MDFPETDVICGPCTDPTQEALDFQALLNDMLDNSISLVDNSANINSYITGTTLASGIFSSFTNCAEYQSMGISNATNCTNLGLTIDLGEDCGGSFNSLANISLYAQDPNNPYCIEFIEDFTGIRAVNFASGDCGEVYEFEIDGIIPMDCNDNEGNSFVKVTFTGVVTTANLPIRSCQTTYSVTNACDPGSNSINPFIYGVRGNWNAVKSFAFLNDRGTMSIQPNDPTNIRTSGTIQNFTPFWQYTGGEWKAMENGWQWTTEVTKRIPEGFDVETVDPLGRYASVQYGYDNRLPVSVAANARHNNIAYANFEYGEDDCKAHFLFDKDYTLFEEIGEAHSGRKSAKIIPGDKLAIKTGFSDGNVSPSTNFVPYTLQEIDKIRGFAPELNTDPSPDVYNKYVIAFWVKSDLYNGSAPVFEYNDAAVKVRADANTLSPISIQRSKIIDGWQQVEYLFDIPKHASNLLEIEFHNNGVSDNIYIDDVRIHPFDSHVQTYVYAEDTQWLLASGDLNGFFKFYNYDKSGKLTGVRQETAEGIISLETHREYVKPREIN